MKNSYLLLGFAVFFFSCTKQNDCPGSNTGPTTNPPNPPAPPAPVTQVAISLNSQPMNITSLSYQRHRNGDAGSLSITASNAFQKVTAVASPFSVYRPPWSMIYVMEVSYFTRRDSLSDWGVTLSRPVPRDDKIYFDTGDPLDNKTVRGTFSGTFIEHSGTKEDQFIVVKGNFTLAF